MPRLPRILLIIFAAFLLLQLYLAQLSQNIIARQQSVTFSVFIDRLSRNEIAEIKLGLRKHIVFKLKDELYKGISYITVVPARGPEGEEYSLLDTLKKYPDIKISSVTDEPISGWLIFFIALVFGIGLHYWWQKYRGQIEASEGSPMIGDFSDVSIFTRARARQPQPTGPQKITFKDVAGVDEAVEELKEIVEFLKNPQRFQQVGAEMPKGVLLVGPPGCGKTLLAKAVAGEANVAFFSMAGSEFTEIFVGVGAARVRDLFAQAKKAEKAVIFIDEIEAIGGKRGGFWNQEREATLAQLLTEMDGFITREGIIVLAATNRPDLLDDALLRPGRFDRKIVVNRPDVRGRIAILKVHAKNKPMAKDVNLDLIAKRTPGFVGADLKNLINEAAMLAARQNCNEIHQRHLEEAIDKVLMGPERKGFRLSEKELEITAYHEAGHALVEFRQWQADPQNADPPRTVSIIPRGTALGVTVVEMQEDRFILTEKQLINAITGIFGGRAAEEVAFNLRSSGSQNDLEKATELAERMVLEWGMGRHEIPPRIFRKSDTPFVSSSSGHLIKNISEETSRRLEEEIAHIVNNCYERAREIILSDRESLEKLARALKEKETLSAEEIQKILGEREKAFYARLIDNIAHLISKMIKPLK